MSVQYPSCMIVENVLSGLGAVGEWLIAWVIYSEWEGGRLDAFLKDAEALHEERLLIYNAYCGLPDPGSKRQNECFKEHLELKENKELRNVVHDNVRLLSRIGARLPKLPWLRNIALDWHVAVFLWEMLGPYVEARRAEAGPSYAKPFIKYALASVKHLLKQERDSWTVHDPDFGRNRHVVLTCEDLVRMQGELEQSLKR